ncbi:pyridoxal kinase [Kaistia sp. 32K]|uniref:pyridoxal kinase n=1 Tax=Kaistia sp. 32K TaxID=2795690 RepID=UPI001934E76B|nr:pyridoxal kinase [Kaistia sp. 32K]BCP55372.1 pyridoxal kinase [Kaistia sp. 32K]
MTEPTMTEPTTIKPAILVLSSSVVRGAVGGRGAVFALERFGHPVWSMQTVTLPWHPGHGRASRVIPDEAAFEALIDDLIRAPWLGEIGAILTGYMGAASQPAAVARLVDAVKAARPDALYLCDPVMGDAGILYVPEATASAIRDHLVPRADILTPNPTELGFLTGNLALPAEALHAAATSLPTPRIAVTSAAGTEGEITTLLVSRNGTGHDTIQASHAAIGGRVPNGTGDLFAALFLARLVGGASDAQALRLATAAVADAIDAAASLGANELPLATIQDQLLAPKTPVRIIP